MRNSFLISGPKIFTITRFHDRYPLFHGVFDPGQLWYGTILTCPAGPRCKFDLGPYFHPGQKKHHAPFRIPHEAENFCAAFGKGAGYPPPLVFPKITDKGGGYLSWNHLWSQVVPGYLKGLQAFAQAKSNFLFWGLLDLHSSFKNLFVLWNDKHILQRLWKALKISKFGKTRIWSCVFWWHLLKTCRQSVTMFFNFGTIQ